jgi:hypothetical protein
LFDILRAHVLSHPLLLFLVCLFVLPTVAGTFRRKVAGTFPGKVPATVVLGVLYLTTVVVYVAIPAYVDHVEPAVTAVSWAVMRGQDAYPLADAPAVYGLPYGPMLYLLNGAAMWLAGPSFTSSKLAGAAAVVISLIVTVLAARRANAVEWPRVLRWMALVYLAFGATTFWVRAEPLLLLCSSIGVLSLTLSPLPAAMAAGAALGVGVNLKISALIYLFPAIVLLAQKHGRAILAVTLGVATLVAALPFLISDNVSAAGYWYWVQTTAGHGFRPRALPAALEWAVFVVIPLSLLARGQQEHVRQLSWMLVLMVFASVPLAVKHGTGAYHFLPFVPFVLFAAGTNQERPPARIAAMLAASIILAGLQLPYWISASIELPASQIIADLRRIERESQGTIAMGYSANYRVSFFRPQLVFDGHPYGLDGASAMDGAWSGRAFPRAAIDAVKSCGVANWVIPSGGAPFEMPNAYGDGSEVFPDELRTAFLARYQLRARGRWFDVWSCAR